MRITRWNFSSMSATLSGACAATSTPAEKQSPSPRSSTTEISGLDSISVRAAESSSIIGISMMFSGGFRRTMCATAAVLSNESRLHSNVLCEAILFRGRGRPRHTSLGPESFFVVLADCLQFSVRGLRSLLYSRCSPQLPAGIRDYIFDLYPRVHRIEIRLAILIETQDRLRRDDS